MNYYLDVFRKFSDFKGRARRSEYWYFTLFHMIVTIVLVAIEMMLWEMPVLTMLYVLAALIPNIAVLVRRLHDTGKSGWMYFISFIPLVGPIIVLVFLCQDSIPGENQWGENPKEIGNHDIAKHLVE